MTDQQKTLDLDALAESGFAERRWHYEPLDQTIREQRPGRPEADKYYVAMVRGWGEYTGRRGLPHEEAIQLQNEVGAALACLPELLQIAIEQRERAERLEGERPERDRLVAAACRMWDEGPNKRAVEIEVLWGLVDIGFMVEVTITDENLPDYEDEGWEVGDEIYEWTATARQALGGDDG